MYLLDVSTPAIRAKIRQEFERNRYVQQLPVVDMLVTKSNMEFQETMNYWKQIPHIMRYFRVEEDSRSHVPKDFMTGFLEVGGPMDERDVLRILTIRDRVATSVCVWERGIASGLLLDRFAALCIFTVQ
jgi:hypothetical protein